MSDSGDLFAEQILSKFNLTSVETLSDKINRKVFLVRDNNDQKLKVLKTNLLFKKKLHREGLFLKTVSNFPFKFLKTPLVSEQGDGYLLMEYLSYEKYTRDTIRLKTWTDSDCEMWVNALMEFQSVPVATERFSFFERMKGKFYPVFRAVEMSKLMLKTLSLFQLIRTILLLLRYLLARPFFSNVTTHYDLNTFNYAESKDAHKMAMIDFEMGYADGDPLYDLLYFLSIPVDLLQNWSFQKKLYLKFTVAGQMNRRFIKTRLNTLLVILNFQRMSRFRDQPMNMEVYKKNLSLLLNAQSFDAWYRQLTKNSSTD